MDRQPRGAWTVGLCANCDGPLDGDRDALFCGDRCRSYAGDVRYFRRRHREGRDTDPDVALALRTRLAHLVGEGYDEKARRVAPELRAEALAANSGLCMTCSERPAVELDHIDGPSGARHNLQGLCKPCHAAKTAARFRPMGPEQIARRNAFLDRVRAEPPLRACDDDLDWDGTWRRLLAETRTAKFADAEEVPLTAEMCAALGLPLPAAEGGGT